MQDRSLSETERLQEIANFTQEALRYFVRFRELKGENDLLPSELLFLCQWFARLEDTENAERAFEAAINSLAVEADSPAALAFEGQKAFELAQMVHSSGRPQAAQEWFRRAATTLAKIPADDRTDQIEQMQESAQARLSRSSDDSDR